MTTRSALAHRAGFTLVELMMVLALLGIISAMGVWGMLPALEHEKVRGAAGIIIADVQYAQTLAARQRRPVAIIFNESLRMYVIRDRGGTTIYRERFLGDDSDYDLEAMVVEVDPSGDPEVEIFPNGITTKTLTVTVGIKDYERQVRLGRTGRVRMLPPTAAGGGK
jgi:type II secretion system protein H